VAEVVFQYISLLREAPPQQWIFQELQGMAEVDFKFKQKTPAFQFTSKISSVMQKPLPRHLLLSGFSRLRSFSPKLITQGIDCLRPDNFFMMIVSRDFPGDWDAKEKWYGTEYSKDMIPMDLMARIKTAYSATAKTRIPVLHLPHKNQFIPTKLEVEKKDVKEPAVAPRLIRNDRLARTWFKKDDRFWVPKANLIVSFKNPITYASAESSVKARLYTDLVKDALEEYSYDAELAGLEYNVTLDYRGLLVEVSGYNDKLPVLLSQVLCTMRDIDIKEDRFAIITERLGRAYRNFAFQQPYYQLSDFSTWLTSENECLIAELSDVLPSITADATRHFHRELLGQFHLEVYVHGNLYKEDALKLTALIESTLTPRELPRSQWPIMRSLVYPPGSNFIYETTLQDPANVNHAIELYLHVGDRADRGIRSKTFMLDQLTHEPAFDKLRTKEQLGYAVFSGSRSSPTTLGFRFIIQSEKTPTYLESRIEAFLVSFADTLSNMSEADFESNKRSLIVKHLEKAKNLDQETGRHWSQIHNEYCDFDYGRHAGEPCRDCFRPSLTVMAIAKQDTTEMKLLTKATMIEFFNEYIHPESPRRAKLVVYLTAKAKSDVSTRQISELVRTLDLSGERAGQAATDLQARLTAAHHDEAQELERMRHYLLKDLMVVEGKVDAAVDAWKRISKDHKANGNGAEVSRDALSRNGTRPVRIEDVRDFKCGLSATAGPRPVRDLSEFEDLDSKL
jgi:insulysin